LLLLKSNTRTIWEATLAGTSVAALNPRLVTAVHPSSSGLLAAAATELAARTGDMWEDDVTFAMERVREALKTLGGLFREDGAMHEMQHHGGRGEDDAAASCHKAGWSMLEAARELGEALAARAR
jgi:hypothetical protein